MYSFKFLHKSYFYKLNVTPNVPKDYLKKCHVEIFHKENNHTLVFIMEVSYIGCSYNISPLGILPLQGSIFTGGHP
jgi:hypothetical protein